MADVVSDSHKFANGEMKLSDCNIINNLSDVKAQEPAVFEMTSELPKQPTTLPQDKNSSEKMLAVLNKLNYAQQTMQHDTDSSKRPRTANNVVN